MKNLFLFLVLSFSALAVAASEIQDKKSLDILITNDPSKSMFYFNGTGTATVERDGKTYIAEMDIDFEHPVDGRYGTLTIYTPERKVVDKYIFTNIQNLGDATSKRILVKGIDGTKESAVANIDFSRDGARNYLLFFFHDPIPYFKTAWNEFESVLRIPPREKSKEELAAEARREEQRKQREAIEQAEREKEAFKQEVYDTTQAIVVFASIIFAIIMTPKAFKRGRFGHLILFTIIAILSSFPPFFILPLIPGYFWWYYNLYNDKRDNDDLADIFKKITYVSFGVLAILFYLLVGNIIIFYGIVWIVAGYIAMMLIYEEHAQKFRCPHCLYYGTNHIMERKLIHQQIVRTVTEQNVFSHREETDSKIIDWYKKRYNVRIEAHQKFKDFRKCDHCNEIFITFHYKTKKLFDKTY